MLCLKISYHLLALWRFSAWNRQYFFALQLIAVVRRLVASCRQLCCAVVAVWCRPIELPSADHCWLCCCHQSHCYLTQRHSHLLSLFAVVAIDVLAVALLAVVVAAEELCCHLQHHHHHLRYELFEDWVFVHRDQQIELELKGEVRGLLFWFFVVVDLLVKWIGWLIDWLTLGYL